MGSVMQKLKTVDRLFDVAVAACVQVNRSKDNGSTFVELHSHWTSAIFVVPIHHRLTSPTKGGARRQIHTRVLPHNISRFRTCLSTPPQKVIVSGKAPAKDL